MSTRKNAGAMTPAQLEARYGGIHEFNITEVIIPITEAREIAERVYRSHGFKNAGSLLSIGAIDKLEKTRSHQLVALALLPANASGIVNTCAFAGECASGCVAFSGNGSFSNTVRSRLARTDLVVNHPRVFVTLLVHELTSAAEKFGTLGIRLNAYSDLRYERMLPRDFFTTFSAHTFYDYTKHTTRSRPAHTLPDNYRLTYSYSERTTMREINANLDSGRNVAVVVATRSGKNPTTKQYRPIPATLLGHPVVDGDMSEDRFADAPNSFVVLRRKHTLRADSPFIFTAENVRV